MDCDCLHLYFITYVIVSYVDIFKAFCMHGGITDSNRGLVVDAYRCRRLPLCAELVHHTSLPFEFVRGYACCHKIGDAGANHDGIIAYRGSSNLAISQVYFESHIRLLCLFAAGESATLSARNVDVLDVKASPKFIVWRK